MLNFSRSRYHPTEITQSVQMSAASASKLSCISTIVDGICNFELMHAFTLVISYGSCGCYQAHNSVYLENRLHWHNWYI